MGSHSSPMRLLGSSSLSRRASHALERLRIPKPTLLVSGSTRGLNPQLSGRRAGALSHPFVHTCTQDTRTSHFYNHHQQTVILGQCSQWLYIVKRIKNIVKVFADVSFLPRTSAARSIQLASRVDRRCHSTVAPHLGNLPQALLFQPQKHKPYLSKCRSLVGSPRGSRSRTGLLAKLKWGLGEYKCT